MLKLRAFIKYIFSFFQRSWNLSDYPIRIKKFRIDPTAPGRFKQAPWAAQIINWWQMGGHGDTRQAALENLRTVFLKRKADGKPFPRPGTGLPPEFASTEEISKYDEFAKEFFPRVLGLNYEDCFISDETSLWDFHNDDSNAFLEQKIGLLYGVDISDVKNGSLVEIFKRISAQSSSR
jgi:hypothetical protein